MSAENPFRIFIVHLFQQNDDYQRIFEYLESRDNFFYNNYSNLDGMPDFGGEPAIQQELRTQIDAAEIVILPLAIVDTNPRLVSFQLDYAQAAKKPLLGIVSFGGTIKVDKAVQERCDDIVEWNERSIISGIKRLARDEDTAMWEVVNFSLD